MFKTRHLISIFLIVTLLIFTSTIKNKTRIIEKKIFNLNTSISIKKRDINETQLDYYYLTSPSELEKRLDIIGFENYHPILFSNIFFDISDSNNFSNKFSNLKTLNEKEIKKK